MSELVEEFQYSISAEYYIQRLRYQLGMITKSDCLRNIFKNIPGVGNVTIEYLSSNLGQISDILDYSERQLISVSNVGNIKAKRIHENISLIKSEIS